MTKTAICSEADFISVPLERRTAVHEAGHAVVALALGLPFAFVTVLDEDDDYPGLVLGTKREHRGSETPSAAQAAEWLANGWLSVLLAGAVAEHVTYGALPLESLIGAASDLHQACKLVTAALPPEQHGEALWRAADYAERLLNQHRPALDAVAAALETRQQLSYAEVIALKDVRHS